MANGAWYFSKFRKHIAIKAGQGHRKYIGAL
jgi:hypothetical protein